MSHPIYRWNGQYFGFVKKECLFNSVGHYVAWLEKDGTVWAADGRFAGELVEDNYVLKRSFGMPHMRRLPRMPPIHPIPPIPSVNRSGRIQRLGWTDGLDDL